MSRHQSLSFIAFVSPFLLRGPEAALAHPFHFANTAAACGTTQLLEHLIPHEMLRAFLMGAAVLTAPVLFSFISVFLRRCAPAVRWAAARVRALSVTLRSRATADDCSAQSSRTLVALVFILTAAASGCGGGGGDGGGGSGPGLHRTTDTAVRILHAGLDFEPVDLRVGDVYLTHAGYLEPNFYVSLDSGSQTLTLERAHSPGVVVNQTAAALKEKTGYSLLISGQVSHGTLQVTLLEEPLVRPEKGQGRVKLVNLLENGGTLALTAAGIALGPVPFRSASDYAIATAGPLTVTVQNNRGGVLAVTAIDVPERGDATVVIGGDNQQGVVIERTFQSLG